MGEAKEARSRAMENLSLQLDKYPRDLLQRFTCNSTQQSEYATPSEDSEEIELNLGLSLGGRFGVDKSAKKLIRSSSIAGIMPVVQDDESLAPKPPSYPTLMRTSSLPTETEEWRKRKELQTLRRMVAKRRRSEKQRSSKAEKEEERKESEGLAGLNLRDKQQSAAANRFSSTLASPLRIPAWASTAREAALGGVVEAAAKGKGRFLGFQGFVRPTSQRSCESQVGCWSGMSELENKHLQGSGSCGEARSPVGNQSLQERSSQEAVGSSVTKTEENPCRTSIAEMENPSKKHDCAENRGKEIGMNAMEDMPCVFTKGDGPNGRRIEGILYKYGKGEDVRIMCVCHGSFLSAAEFVKHAGGGDVAHPLRHIVVNPSSASFS
ncbi:ninja-family protein AFP3-like [Juglans microcarpa x Juglans regia]|uniref:ninja-family protein AFP3-like n=1 Tax=Juglans microcarpa x Juglans regia TaxID=2249226 RepID=UPI001B7DA697|nr:ninja-family protein AFP3-like [Juglans microcarpa x Juglans regia]